MTPFYLVELLVRLGVAVIADGTIKPRWYGSDQAKVCKRVQWQWRHGHFTGILRRKVTPTSYYTTRHEATGSNWQHKQYCQGKLETMWPEMDAFERNVVNQLTAENYQLYKHLPIVKRLLA
jgi:hypothetical protein